MKSFPVRRLLASLLLLGVLGAGMAVWLLGTEYARKRLAQAVREGLTHDSELVVGPFEVDFSPWRDFPYLTASLHHLSLTDTAYQQQVPVLRIARADLRLHWAGLLRGQAHVTRLVVSDVDFRERVDSLGHSWGLRGKRRKGTGKAPTLNLELDQLLVNNFRMSAHNAYSRSEFGAEVRQARLTARLRGGVLQVAGTLKGQLSYLRTRTGSLFEQEPVQAWVNYQYTFAKREGRLWNTRATLNEDTIQVSGTHRVDPSQPVGTLLKLKFVGNQPLTDVLHAALPPRLEPYLTGATSPSHAHIQYTITGLSGPTITPRNVLTFSLRNGRLQWPDATQRISRWDLQGTYDNGPAHNPTSTALTLQRCRIYSPAGQLDAAISIRDFTRPFVEGHVRGQTELGELAAVVVPGRWQARQGTADIDVRLRGRLPPLAGRLNPRPLRRNMSVRGSVTLRHASFVVPVRGADISGLNVRVGLQDSVWRLSNASGVLNGMTFRATAVTTNLYDYLGGLQPSARIAGTFTVDELRIDRLRALLRPVAQTNRAGFSPTSLPKPSRAPRDRAQLAATLGSELLPAGLLLDVDLRCQRLILASDTLNQLAVTVRHDGQRVQLLNLAGRVWNGDVRGNVEWPTDSTNQVAPVQYRLGVHFATLNYQQFLARLARPDAKATPPTKAKGAAIPALRDLLLAANGQLSLDIDRLVFPGNESIAQVRLRTKKTGGLLQVPFLRFQTPGGGQGEATATAQLDGMHLLAADADVTLRYKSLDVQRLLGIVASLTAPAQPGTSGLSLARATRRATRRALRQQTQPDPSLLTNGVLSAVLRVEADEVRYADVRGRGLRLVSRLLEGEARLDQCTFNALGGRIGLRGLMVSTPDRAHHPTQAQVSFEDIQLPALFATATDMGLSVLDGASIRGTVRGEADLRTDLGATFLPDLMQTTAYLKTNLQDLELLNVEPLMEALKFIREERTRHLVFEPVRSEFILINNQLLIPDLRLNSNLSSLNVSGRYVLRGPTSLFIGLKPLQALFGNNDKRVERIQDGEPKRNANRKLTYINLHRAAPGDKFKVRFFQKEEQRREQATLQQEYRDFLLTQRLDTTLRVLR
ncbi:AsmA family protein [Hymenobacter sp. IS2118]|uniref:AsmA family protein n=1 Tax=Hymenobacter sp. IS2118 TaxID=1505605 RepID=UPI0009073B16|nr:AsmA-like C-terminal region-containing protein [Hymenobacter sp. IS2118]